MKLSALILLNFLALSCVQGTKESIVTGGSMSSSAPGVWLNDKAAFPKTIRISTGFYTKQEEADAIVNTLNAWETGVGYNFFTVGASTSEDAANVSNLRSLNDGVFGVYKLRDWPSEDFGYASLAVTQIFGRGYNQGTADAYNVIYHADIILNDTKEFRTSASGEGYDLETVMLHEFGHFLGLNHNYDKAASVMYGYIDDTDERRVPKAKDIQDLKDRYSIGTSGSGGAQPTSRRFRPLNNDPGEEIHIIMQLQTNGDCVHKVNGVEYERHSVKLK